MPCCRTVNQLRPACSAAPVWQQCSLLPHRGDHVLLGLNIGPGNGQRRGRVTLKTSQVLPLCPQFSSWSTLQGVQGLKHELSNG